MIAKYIQDKLHKYNYMGCTAHIMFNLLLAKNDKQQQPFSLGDNAVVIHTN